MPRLAPLVLLACGLLAALCRGQDFDLGEALEDPQPTKKPASPKRPPAGGGDFDLGDAVLGEDDSKKQATAAPPPPNPGSHGNNGDAFSDLDLTDGKPLPDKPGGGRASNPSGGGHDSDSKNENAEGSQGMLAGIISSVVVAIVGAASSFIAYQKKKLCFKQSDQENVNMENQQGIHAEPPVQRTLLQKQ
ncbi:CD99 antigen-like isoform X1 [Tiliqua scincoides]|uniref:CD99 antigen-like isoform X1 n=1 Tax=Tiliqua scincoides TaxID=71010 RepID=UPI003461E412